MKLKEFGPQGGCASLMAPLDLPLNVNGNNNSEINQSEITDKNSLNWFKPGCPQLLDVTDSQKRLGHMKL